MVSIWFFFSLFLFSFFLLHSTTLILLLLSGIVGIKNIMQCHTIFNICYIYINVFIYTILYLIIKMHWALFSQRFRNKNTK